MSALAFHATKENVVLDCRATATPHRYKTRKGKMAGRKRESPTVAAASEVSHQGNIVQGCSGIIFCSVKESSQASNEFRATA